jgi:hypothetical protein
MPDSTATAREALESIRGQVDAAHATAERLVREAEEAARSHTAGVPPRGWADAPPGTPAEVGPGTAIEALQAVAGLLEVVRSAVPPELASQFTGALRELLKALRALIDFYLERLDAPPPQPKQVEDIPID